MIHQPRSGIAPPLVWAAALLALLFLAAILLPAFSGSRKNPSIACVSHEKQICLAAIMWSQDRNARELPSDFLCFSNELVSPGILVCPEDRKHRKATSWASFTPANSSYEIVSPGVAADGTNSFIRCPIHGHIGLADGSVVWGRRR